MTEETIHTILEQATSLGTVRSIYFEGGEPFLRYPTLVAGVRDASRRGFRTGIVSNGYWANNPATALEKLRPLSGYLNTLLISDDLYHQDEKFKDHSRYALEAAKKLGISWGVIEISSPDAGGPDAQVGQIQAGASGVMYRGRAAHKLSGGNDVHPWEQFTSCPYEDLRNPGRVHLDPLGYVHICQGISMGNIFQNTLEEICATYDPDSHPVTAPLLRGGPAELCRVYEIPHLAQFAAQYADVCHLCYRAREALRQQLPEVLAPDQVYGVYASRPVKSAVQRRSDGVRQQSGLDQLPGLAI